jgi:hypothetical protein
MRTNLCIATAVVLLLAPNAVRAQNVLLYDFETPDQHREPNLPSNPTTPPGWGSFGAITLDRGPASELTNAPMDVWLTKGTYPASAGDWSRYHLGDFDLPWDLPGNYGLINVSDRFAGKRKDFSGFTGLSVDAMFLSHASIPFEGVAEIEIGFGFITPGVGVEDEDKSVYAPPQLLTDVYQTFTVSYSDFEFVQSPEELAVDLAQYAFLKIRVNNTEFNSGLGILVYDEVYGIVGGTPAVDADFNDDGIVDGADFLIWQRGFGLGGQTSNALGDADGSGVIDGADLEVWKTQFGPPASAAIAAVPECSGVVLAMLAALPLARRTPRK